MKDAPIAICPECEGPVIRLLYPVGVVFKGSGWYINDSRKPEKAEGSAESESAAPTAASAATPAASTEAPAKTATPTAAKE